MSLNKNNRETTQRALWQSKFFFIEKAVDESIAEGIKEAIMLFLKVNTADGCSYNQIKHNIMKYFSLDEIEAERYMQMARQ